MATIIAFVFGAVPFLMGGETKIAAMAAAIIIPSTIVAYIFTMKLSDADHADRKTPA
jgi:hypothetical protein